MNMNKIKIGYKTYDIVYDNYYLDEKELTGEIDYYNKKIIVRDDRDKVEFLNTFLHEILHGIFYHSGDRNLKEDENLINCIANGLTQVIVDNNIEIIFQKSKPKIDKHEDWIGKKVNCWDDVKSERLNIMEYVGFNEGDFMAYECVKEGVKFLWKSIELVDDENA